MKKISVLIIPTLLLLISNTVFAKDLYVFGQFGRVYQENLPNIPGTARDTVNKYGYRLGLGYDIDNAIHPAYSYGAMLGYANYGKTIWNDFNNNAALSHSIMGLDIQGNFTYHADPSLDLIAHGGALFAQDKVVENFNEKTKNHAKLILGVGAAYTINPQLGVTFDYSHVFGNSVSENNFSRLPTMNIYWLGLRYKFKGAVESQ